MQKDKKILILNDTGLNGGGAEKRIKSLIEKLEKQDDVKEVHLLETGKGNAIKAVYKAINKYNINLVQVHNIPKLFCLPLIPVILKKIPFIWFMHDYWPICAHKVLMNPFKKEVSECENEMGDCIKCAGIREYLKTKIKKFFIKRSDAIIVAGENGRDVADRYLGLGDRCRIVKPWIRQVFFEVEDVCNIRLGPGSNVELGRVLNKSKSDNLLVCYVGSLLPYKGVHVFFEAIKKLNMDNIDFYIAGPDQDNEYKEEIKNVHYMGSLSKKQLIDLLKKTNIFVIPSICSEIFGQVWAEAMALGNYVIASSMGGIPEYIKNKGLLFEPGDAIDLAEKIKCCIDNKLYLDKKIINENIQYVKDNFCLENSFLKIMDIYEELIDDRKNKKRK